MRRHAALSSVGAGQGAAGRALSSRLGTGVRRRRVRAPVFESRRAACCASSWAGRAGSTPSWPSLARPRSSRLSCAVPPARRSPAGSREPAPCSKHACLCWKSRYREGVCVGGGQSDRESVFVYVCEPALGPIRQSVPTRRAAWNRRATQAGRSRRQPLQVCQGSMLRKGNCGGLRGPSPSGRRLCTGRRTQR